MSFNFNQQDLLFFLCFVLAYKVSFLLFHPQQIVNHQIRMTSDWFSSIHCYFLLEYFQTTPKNFHRCHLKPSSLRVNSLTIDQGLANDLYPQPQVLPVLLNHTFSYFQINYQQQLSTQYIQIGQYQNYSFIMLIETKLSPERESEIHPIQITNSPLRKTYFRLREMKQQNISPLKLIQKSSPKNYSDFYTHQQITLERIKIKESKLSITANNFFGNASRTQKVDYVSHKETSPMRKTLYSSPKNERGLLRPPSSSESTILRRTSLNLRSQNIFKDQNNDNYLNKYQIIKQLGKGSFSTVYLAKKRQQVRRLSPQKQSKAEDSLYIMPLGDRSQKKQKQEELPQLQPSKGQECQKVSNCEQSIVVVQKPNNVPQLPSQGQQGELVAIKVYQKFKMNKDPHKFKNIRKEVNIMQNLEHGGILKLYENVQTLTRINLVVEYGGDHSLLQYVKNNYPLSFDKVKDISLQLIKAIAYIHEKNIIHRDIKLQNVLIHHDRIKLIDFGFSCLTHKNQKLSVICGTPNYMAPEVISRKEYIGEQADIWSYGVVVYALAEGRHPFKAETYGQLQKLVARGKFQFKKTNDQPFADFIRRILKVKGSERPTAKQIMESKWLRV